MTSYLLLRVLAGALISGASVAAAGFLLASLRLSFLSVTMSHAAMAGAVFARLAGLDPFPGALAAALAAALVIGPLAERARLDVNLAMGVVFSLSLGLAFLGIGLAQGNRSDLLGLIWGSVLLLTTRDLALQTGAALLLFLAVGFLEKEIKAVMFSRSLAAASGLPGLLIISGLLALTGTVITASLETVGGLMLFSLLTNPAAAAGRLFSSFRTILSASALLGAASALLGIGVSALFNLPAGASIVLASAFLLLLALVVASRRERQPAEARHE